MTVMVWLYHHTVSGCVVLFLQLHYRSDAVGVDHFLTLVEAIGSNSRTAIAGLAGGRAETLLEPAK